MGIVVVAWTAAGCRTFALDSVATGVGGGASSAPVSSSRTSAAGGIVACPRGCERAAH